MNHESVRKLEKGVIYFTFAYITAFSIRFFLLGNLELIYYMALIIVSMAIILIIHKRINFYPIVLEGLSLLGLLHLIGENINIGSIRLYDWYFYNPTWSYDHFVQIFGSAITVTLAYALLQPVLKTTFKGKDVYFILLLVLIALGLSSINQLVEFMAAFIFNSGHQVCTSLPICYGLYRIALWNLTFNCVGAVIMAVIVVKSKVRLVKPE